MSHVMALRERHADAVDDAPPGAWPLAEPFRIGTLELENRVVQAPLAGIANWAFRRQSRRHGAGLAVSEMVASFGLHYGNERTHRMLEVTSDEHPVGIQLFGTDPGVMAESAAAVQAAGADLVDINMGCPVRKVCKTGAGAALLDADGALGARIVRAMTDAVDIPVTVKMRRGLTPATSRPVELAKRFEGAGAAAIVFHPRAAAEEYAGAADHAITAAVVAAVGIPVIASGDITTPQIARRVMEDSGCAAIAVGRAILGDPWLFRSLATGAAHVRPDLPAVVTEIEAFAADLRLVLGDARAAVELRKFIGWYLAGRAVTPEVRLTLQTQNDLDGCLALLRRLARESEANAA